MQKPTPKMYNDLIFEEVREGFKGIDTGPAAIYQQIHYHLMGGMDEVATRLAYHASELLEEEGSENMTDTEKFLEVFRRTAFGPLNNGVYSSSEYEAYIQSMEHSKNFLLGIVKAVKEAADGDS